MATKEQIWAAADAISAEGGNPTLAAVRVYMGGGSYTDRCRAGELPSRQAVCLFVNLPPQPSPTN